MARLVQLSDLRARTRKRADIENATTFIPDADVNQYINNGWARVYGMLVESGEPYYSNPTYFQWTTVSQQDVYYSNATALSVPAGTNVLPSDMYKIRGVDSQIQLGRWMNCQRSEFEQRNDYQQSDWSWPLQVLYEFEGSGNNASLRLQPPPPQAQPMRLKYWPTAVILSNDTDTVDGGNGWEDYAVDYAARYCATKDENYALIAELDRNMGLIEGRIKAEAANRLAGQPFKVRRTNRYKRTGWPWPGGGGWY